MDKKELLENIEKVHTTKMGIVRIKKNLELDTDDIANFCKWLIKKDECFVHKKGKNYYCITDNYTITINSYSFTIITAHKS